VSIGLIVTIIVLLAVVLTLVVRDNNDDNAANNVAPAPAPAFTTERMGDGLLGGRDEAVAMLQAHTGVQQGEGSLTTADDAFAVDRPLAYYVPMAGEGRFGGYVAEDTVASDNTQARRAYDKMLFDEWNDPVGWAASPAPRAVLSADEMYFLEQNGVYDFEGRGFAAAPAAPAAATVESFEHSRFMEMNTNLPGWTDHEAHRSDRQRFTEF